ncbi:hypothetical protein DICPUDRAFT_159346 [Dictyostelium purpureum]|uniref:TIR domain-containing protein n=1 Tax=Dictyostelium purpureum TaxID=5786 RepID=F1A3W2_DICPU|nr:uncharacterized protein DICPUDRAFT_159346 [Dictyostelium purpureum]EGC29117.1 hypothetical protein DICPUDRAFT_159346 [Dictyostelium purpureum]|eukprot:XP_003294357.1 hypothetical protein DICPUDRAFT_159346 [Dictyostelium purpureum]
MGYQIKNSFDTKLFNTDNNKIFKDKKFYCFSLVKCPKEKSIKEDIMKLIEIHGGTVQYCVQKFSTDYIILCNSKTHYDKNDSYYAYQPNLFSNYEKYKSYNINILSYDFLVASIERNEIIDDLGSYLLYDMKEVDNVLELSFDHPDTEDLDNPFYDFHYGYDDNNGTSESKVNYGEEENENDKEREEEEEEKDNMYDLFDFSEKLISQEESNQEGMFDLFDFGDNEEKQIEKKKETEEDGEMCDLFNFNEDELSHNKPKLTEKNNLYNQYTWGFLFQFSNLGIKAYDQLPQELKNREIKGFCQNPKGFTAITTKSQELFCYEKTMKVKKIQHSQCKEVSLGQDHTLILTRQIAYDVPYTYLFSTGTNHFGQLGIGKDSEPSGEESGLKGDPSINFYEVPKYLLKGFQIDMISCGKNFSILLDNQSNLFSFGQNDYGQLGLGHCDKTNGICKIEKPKGLDRVCYISSGENHTVVIAPDTKQNNDYYWGWGSNSQGQLENKFSNKPHQFQFYNENSYSSKLFCYQDSTVIISIDNQIKIFGTRNELENKLKMYFYSNQQYQLIRFRNSIGLNVLDAYSQVRFYLHSHNYSSEEHYKIISKIIKTSITNSDAIKLVADCFLTSNILVYQLLESKFPGRLIHKDTKRTPYHIAAEYCTAKESIRILEFLNSFKGYSIDSPDFELNTPIHLSVLHVNFLVTEFLLLQGCNRNPKNKVGETPLHVSVKTGTNISMSSLLCRNGAQSIPDRVMKTPLQYCTNMEEKQNLQNIIFTNQVFISYAHKDSVFVNNLRSIFGLSSLRCWLDEYRLQAGCNWRAEITRGVENSQVIVFVVSETSVQSLWCRKELKMSKSLGKTIIPLFLQPNVYIDPSLYGLFTIIPKQTKESYQDMKEEEVLSNVKTLSRLINSLLKNGLGGRLNESSSKSLVEKYNIEKTIYFTFNQADRILADYVKETLIEKNHLPLVSNDEINGKLDENQDPFSYVNILKEKKKTIKIRNLKLDHNKQIKDLQDYHSKKLWKLSRKIDKKLEKLGFYDKSSIDYEITKKHLESEFNIKQIKLDQQLELNNLKKNHLCQLNKKFGVDIENELKELNIKEENNNNSDYNNNNNDNNNGYNYYSSYNNNDNNSNSNNNISNYDNYFSNNIENDIPVLNNYNFSNDNNNNSSSYNYNYSFGDIDYSSNNIDNNDSDNSDIGDNNDNYNIDISFNIKESNLEYLKKCLLHLVLFTKKTTSTEIENYIEEIKYTSSLKKTIVVISPDISLQDDESTPSLLKNLTWYELDIKNVDQMFGNIILVYDIIEKTNQINNQIKNFQNK